MQMLTLTKRSQAENENCLDDDIIKFDRFRARVDMMMAKHNVKINKIDMVQYISVI